MYNTYKHNKEGSNEAEQIMIQKRRNKINEKYDNKKIINFQEVDTFVSEVISLSSLDHQPAFSWLVVIHSFVR
jgi:hypothetical protein